MKQRIFYTELVYLFGILSLALGTALMEKANFGVSMVVAPAYLLYLKLSESLSFFTFGMAEFLLQVVLLTLAIAILHKIRLSYLFSFVTAGLYGAVLDGLIFLIAPLPVGAFAARLVVFLGGMAFCALGVSLFFHTYISPEVYELFVKEVSAKFSINIHRFKTVYDCVSCAAAIGLSFCFFGLFHFEGVKLGTVFCALVNGFLISRFSAFLERQYVFADGLALRRYFER